MQNSKKMTMALIVGNRGFFPDQLAKTGREEMIRVLQAAEIDVVVLGPEESKHGAVETHEEAKRCAQLFRANADHIDGVIVTLPNFGDERAIADTLRLARLGVPVLVQATPDTAGKMTIAHRRDSFCGKMSACNNLKQYGIPYSLTSLHTVSPDSEEFKKDLAWFAGVCRVVRGLRNLRIGAIGARPTAFNTVRYSEKTFGANGISVETLDLSEVMGRICRMKRHRRACRRKAEEYPEVCLDKWNPAGGSAEDGETGGGYRRLDENRGRANQRGAVLDVDGRKSGSSAVHGDEHDERFAAIERVRNRCLRRTRHARLALASETPSALLDWNNNYGTDPDKAVCFHCSNLPKHFFKRGAHGFPGDHCGHRRKGKYVRNVRGPSEIRRDEFCAIFDGRFAGKIRGYEGPADLPTIRWKRSAAQAWSKFRRCRSCCAISVKTDSSITSRRISRP